MFDLTTNEARIVSQLQEILHHNIEAVGGIDTSQFFQTCLYNKDYGYYNNSLIKFGSRGDFITAPNITSLFAKTFSNQILELFENGVSKNIIELGAGNGNFMFDILEELGDYIDNYFVFEQSAFLINLQFNLLKNHKHKHKVKYINKLENCEGIIIANEFLDAMPALKIKWSRGQLSILKINKDFEIYEVAYNELLFSNAFNSYVKSIKPEVDDYISEINYNNYEFVVKLSSKLNKGVIIFIDYGYGKNEYYSRRNSGGTLRGFYKHHLITDYNILFNYPGIIDITSSVDFSLICHAGITDLDFIGYTSQANFLINCNILSFLEKKSQLALSNQLNKLLSPNHLGEIFKVIAFSKNIEFDDWIGFKNGDKSYIL